MNFENHENQLDTSTYGILKIVIPLVVSSLSANLMFLIDRIFLAYYSIDSMNSAMLGGNLAGIYTFLLLSITGTTEVFVGQYNGSGKRQFMAAPVWQMIYFVGISLFFVIPLGYFTKYLNLIPACYANEGIIFQKILTYGCWLPALTAAFTGFFVGQGQTKIVTAIVIIGNTINVILDYLFIFGYKNIIPEMGSKGAAFATVIAEFVQVIILAVEFWNKKNRGLLGTAKNNKFNKQLFLKGINIGFPFAVGRCMDLLAWYLIYVALSHVSKDLATIQGIVVTAYVLCEFMCDGITKSSAVISANLIGRHDLAAIRKNVKKLIIIASLLCIVTMTPLLLFPSPLFKILGSLHENISGLFPTMKIIFRLAFFIITLDAIASVFLGVLSSGGDTKYPNIANLSSLWIFVVCPVLIIFTLGKLHSVVFVYCLLCLWITTFLALVIRRYKSLKWYKSLIN